MIDPGRHLLRQRFFSLQKALASSFEADRSLPHMPTRGAASEKGWLDMLERYLPKRYCVTQAFVIDSLGQQSQQIDLVIHDRHFSPFLLNHHGALYIPAESVYAVFEVKQGLERETVRDAGEKAASVRNLRRTSMPVPWAGGITKPREPIPILAGLLCFESRWSPEFGEPLTQALAELAAPERLDLVCALTHGSFEVEYPDGALPRCDVSQPDTALIFFFLRLLERLQKVATVPAMDIREYAKVLEEPS